MTYKITTYGNPVLRKKAAPIPEVTDEIRQLADDMLETMHSEQGLGLAAEQIGKSVAICVIDIPADADLDENEERANPDVEMPLVLINPTIIETSDYSITYQEGCLSFPGISCKVKRSRRVIVEATDLKGNVFREEDEELAARICQHEIDHLDGRLLVDRMSMVAKLGNRRALKDLEEEFAG